MYISHKIKSLATSPLLLLIGMLLLACALPHVAYAASNKNDPVLAACMKAVPDKFDNQACSSSNIKKAHEAAALKCESSNNPASCTDGRAEQYLTQAASPKPTSAADYTSQLKTLLDRVTGSQTSTSAGNANQQGGYQFAPVTTDKYCGEDAGDNRIDTAIDFGCKHKGPALLDLTFAIIRFLSNGAGLFIIGSLVVGGIQYTIARSDPQASAAAQNRIRAVVIALAIFIFAYAFLNYLIPGQLLK